MHEVMQYFQLIQQSIPVGVVLTRGANGTLLKLTTHVKNFARDASFLEKLAGKAYTKEFSMVTSCTGGAMKVDGRNCTATARNPIHTKLHGLRFSHFQVCLLPRLLPLPSV